MNFDPLGMRFSHLWNGSGAHSVVGGMSPRRFPSPLRYPGGKGKITNFIKLLFLENDLLGSEYVEVYAGGASVALSLLFEEFASHVHINDLNRSVHCFWHVALSRPDDLCRRILETEVSPSEWHRQKAIQIADDADELDLAFSTFFLNRTSRSGILEGGMIGGVDQTGYWKVDARYNKRDLVRRVHKIGRFASRISVTRLDGADYIRNVLPSIRDGFVYLDPPYFEKGQRLYENFYKYEDHAEIAGLVRAMKSPNWVVSYDCVPELLELYAGFPSLQYDLSYSARDRYRGSEVMFFSPVLVLPRVDSPARISADVVDVARQTVFR